jgi:hypothetical protein
MLQLQRKNGEARKHGMGELQQDDFEDGMGWTQIADRTFENVLLL